MLNGLSGFRTTFTFGLAELLLLSDGVTKVFHPMEAATIIQEYDDNCRAVTELARRSIGRGSIDDITALLIEVENIYDTED